MKIRFLRQEIIRDPNNGKIIRTFEKDEVIETADEVAAHWIGCGAAECADAPAEAPAPVVDSVTPPARRFRS